MWTEWVSRLSAVLRRSLWLVAAAAVVVAWIVASGYDVAQTLTRQLAPLQDVLTVCPIPVGHRSDNEFWAAQVLGILLICITTFVALNNEAVWNSYVIPAMFRTKLQIAAFRILGLQTVKGVIFMFASRQLLMVWQWLFQPTGANTLPGALYPGGDLADLAPVTLGGPALSATASSADVGPIVAQPWTVAAVRHFWDGKVVVLLYLTLSMLWFGVQIGLFSSRGGISASPLMRRRNRRTVVEANVVDFTQRLSAVLLSRGMVQGVLFVAVAILRTYPALNAAGVDMGTAVNAMVTRFPLTLIIIGGTAMLPSMLLGRVVKAHMGLTLRGVTVLNILNVSSVLWAQQAGRQFASHVLESLPAAPMSAPLAWSMRALVVLMFVAVVSVFVHAVHVLYGGSPLFLCEWGLPTFKNVSTKDMPRVQQYLDAIKGPLMSRGRGRFKTAMNSTLFLQSLLGMGLALHNLWSGEEMLAIAFTFEVPVKNDYSTRELRLKGLRLVVNVGKESRVFAAAIKEMVVPVGEHDVDVTLTASMSVDSLVALARSAQRVQRFEVLLCADSHLSDQLVFTFPIVSYNAGQWTSVLNRDQLSSVPSRLAKDKRSLVDLTTKLETWRGSMLETELSAADTALRSNLSSLVTVLHRVAKDTEELAAGRMSGMDVLILEDLLEAAYHLVSIHVAESESNATKGKRGKGRHSTKTVGGALLQTATVVMNMFYEASAAKLLGGHDPLHPFIMSAGMLCLQCFLYPDHLKRGVQDLMDNPAPEEVPPALPGVAGLVSAVASSSSPPTPAVEEEVAEKSVLEAVWETSAAGREAAQIEAPVAEPVAVTAAEPVAETVVEPVAETVAGVAAEPVAETVAEPVAAPAVAAAELEAAPVEAAAAEPEAPGMTSATAASPPSTPGTESPVMVSPPPPEDELGDLPPPAVGSVDPPQAIGRALSKGEETVRALQALLDA